MIVITKPAATEYTHSDTLVLDYSVTDGGSGVATVTPTMDGATTVAGAGLPSGRAILLLTALSLGDHTFAVGAVLGQSLLAPIAEAEYLIAPCP